MKNAASTLTSLTPDTASPQPAANGPAAPVLGDIPTVLNGLVYCPICTHSVPAKIQRVKKRLKVLPAQPCPRCNSALDAAFVIRAELN